MGYLLLIPIDKTVNHTEIDYVVLTYILKIEIIAPNLVQNLGPS